jgi:hypothetical protein
MSVTAEPPGWAKWNALLKWSPFKIDALGLVTLLGAEEVNGSVGRLVRSTWFEYFPLLGAFVIAGDAFRSKVAGFNLYNITQGIHTTDMAAWLTRWLQSQDFDTNRSLVRWTVEPRVVSNFDRLTGMILPFCANGMLIAMTILSYDWYGFANAFAMFTSIVVRCYLVSSIRGAIDRRVKLAYDKSKPDPKNTFPEALTQWHESDKKAKAAINGTVTEIKDSRRPHPLEVGWNGAEPAKVLIIMNDAKAVTMLIPRDLLAPPSVFIANLEPTHPFLYACARWIGWLAFAVQVITLGMADLATQIVTVTLLIIPTVLFVARLGCPDSKWQKSTALILGKLGLSKIAQWIYVEYDYGPYMPVPQSVSWIGSMLKAEVYEWPVSHEFVLDENGNVKEDEEYDPSMERPISKRQHLYAWLQLSKEERVSMDKWDLFPHQRGNNMKWAETFDKMTLRTMDMSVSNWGVKSLVGIAGPAPPRYTAPAPAAPTQPTPAPKVMPKLATHVPKQHHLMKSSKEEEEQDTADTAQDGTNLEPNTPSIRSSPGVVSDIPSHRFSAAFSPTAQDIQEGIRPMRRVSTEPARARRQSVTAPVPHPSESAFWVTSRISEQETEGEISDLDECRERRPVSGGGANPST